MPPAKRPAESSLNAGTKKLVEQTEEKLSGRIDAMEEKMEASMRKFEHRMTSWMETQQSAATVQREELSKLVRECVAESSLVTNTPISAVHGDTLFNKGIYSSIEQFNADSSRVETLLEG